MAGSVFSTRHEFDQRVASASDWHVFVVANLNVTMQLRERQQLLLDAIARAVVSEVLVAPVGFDLVIVAVPTSISEVARDHISAAVGSVRGRFVDEPAIVQLAQRDGTHDVVWEALVLAAAERQVLWHSMFADEFAHASSTAELACYVIRAATELHDARCAWLELGEQTWGDREVGEPAGLITISAPSAERIGTLAWWGGAVAADIPAYAAVVASELSTSFTYLLDLDRSTAALEIDELTGLLTRTGLRNAVRRIHDHYAVAFIDIDKFKYINDNFGHTAGDQAIQHAARLVARRRQTDLVARWGGDEFVAVLPGTTGEEAAALLRAQIDSELLAIDGHRFTLSVGIAQSHVGAAFDEVVGNADAAMYTSKTGGGGRVTLRSVE